MKNLFISSQILEKYYCHFKSNEHLEEGFNGETDLDILVAESDYSAFTNNLATNGFIRVVSPHWNSYPGIEDWLGYDEERKVQLHIHLHTSLLIGKKFVKEIHLPWEQNFLETSVVDSTHEVKIAEPHHELLLLFIRIGLKTTYIQLFRASLKRTALPKNIIDELEYLLPQTTIETFQSHARLLAPAYEKQLESLYLKCQQHISFSLLLKIRRVAATICKPYRRTSLLQANMQYFLRAIRVRALQKIYKQGFSVTIKKSLPEQGCLISIIGADGSGKSTLVPKLEKKLSWKLEVRRVYLGRHWLFPLLGKLRNSLRKKRVAHQSTSGKQSGKQSWFTVIQHLLNARIRYKKLKGAARYVANGYVVITDRFPQTQFSGINDSPSIHVDSNSGWLRRHIAHYEYNLYEKMVATQPNLAIKLQVSPHVAVSRKPDHTEHETSKKCEVVANLEFPNSVVQIIDTDNNSPERVLETAEEHVWNMLLTKYAK